MKVHFFRLTLFCSFIGLLPIAAFSQSGYELTLNVQDSCKACWVNSANGSTDCESQCSAYCDSSGTSGRVAGGKPSCEDFKSFMSAYVERVQTCTVAEPRNMEAACNNDEQKNFAQAHLDNALREHNNCTVQSEHYTRFQQLECARAYNRCRQQACAEGDFAKLVGPSGVLTLYMTKSAAHSTLAFENGCHKVWVQSGFENIFGNYSQKKDAALRQYKCLNNNPEPPSGGGDDTNDPPADKAKDKEDEEKEETRKKSNPVTQGMNSLGQLAQMAQPFMAQPGGQAIDFTGGGVPVQNAQNFRPSYPIPDAPDFFNTGVPSGYPEADEPFLGDEGQNGRPRAELNNNSQGNSSGTGGGGMGMMGGHMMGQQGSGSASSASSSGGRPRRGAKRDKTLFSSRNEEGGVGGGVLGSDGASPAALTKHVARKVGFDQNGQHVDQSFDASKYAPKINDVYNRAINSRAMDRAMKRAAGFETLSSENSRGYTSWHKTHNIHPGQLSIFKQVRICYILKYSTSYGTCGGNSN